MISRWLILREMPEAGRRWAVARAARERPEAARCALDHSMKLGLRVRRFRLVVPIAKKNDLHEVCIFADRLQGRADVSCRCRGELRRALDCVGLCR